MIKLRRILKEDIESDYKGSYSDIDRDIFDKIIALDPTARGNQLGSFAKQLLLRCYKAGDTSFIERGEEVTRAIQKFITTIRSNRDVDGKYKNPSYYKSVADFIDFVNDPTKEIEGASKADEPKEDKLTQTYNKYYKDKISRDEFDKLLTVEDSQPGTIGPTVKNFILPKYIASSDSDKAEVLKNLNRLKSAINNYNSKKNSFNSEHQNLEGFESLKEFIEIALNGETSTLVNYLRGLGSQVWSECNYLGSTSLHDIFQPKTRRAAAYIAGADRNSLWSPAKDYCSTRMEDKNSPNAYAYSYSGTAFGHWCTVTDGSFWSNTGSNYRGPSTGIYYDIMAKGSALWERSRKANYQFGIGPDGVRYGAADGEED